MALLHGIAGAYISLRRRRWRRRVYSLRYLRRRLGTNFSVTQYFLAADARFTPLRHDMLTTLDRLDTHEFSFQEGHHCCTLFLYFIMLLFGLSLYILSRGAKFTTPHAALMPPSESLLFDTSRGAIDRR